MTLQVTVPDIGDYQDVPVIDILVKVGDVVSVEQALITLESDKATMDVPSPGAGRVASIALKVGDKVSQGGLVLTLETAAEAPRAEPVAPPVASGPSASSKITVLVPDIGDFKDVPVIDVLVKVGDPVSLEQALLTLESDKATMDVPSPAVGHIESLLVRVGDKVAQGTPIAVLVTEETRAAPPAASPAPTPTLPEPPKVVPGDVPAAPERVERSDAASLDITTPHGSPSVRRFARELGVDLNRVVGSGPKGRITEEDVKAHVKGVMQSGASATGASSIGGLDLLPWPNVDFAKFGPIEAQPLSRIKKLSGANLHRNWVRIPHVTNHDEADITDLESLRISFNHEYAKAGIKFTALSFLIKAACSALREFPEFNASLDADNLVLKRYYHIGFAADTPNGLVVPVLKEADRKGIIQIATESAELAKKAREGKLSGSDMQGGSFSISSLGGIGGGHFTPIINAPEVAILGVGRASMKPVWQEGTFKPRLMLPISLSYDHRVIDGALAARFNAMLVALLADMRRALL